MMLSVEDLRRLARCRVPRMFYDYADSGAWSESTYRANQADFSRLRFRQRVGIDVGNLSLACSMLGEPARMPVAVAPCGLTGMFHADGEILAARAAQKFGVPFTLSTMSIASIEDLAAHLDRPFWFQLYVMRDRSITLDLMNRAYRAGCRTLVLTLDLQLAADRYKDVRNGLSAPPKFNLRSLFQLLSKPRWCMGMLGTRRRGFGNLAGYLGGVSDMASLSEWIGSQFDPTVTWNDVRDIRERWQGKLVLKGIMDPLDAKQAVQCGADAIIVSNHGGRQLDGTESSIRALPRIVESAGDEAEVYLDGGVRCGQDVLRARALGAKGVFIGRPILYGLGAMGEAGVLRCLEIIERELGTTMAFCGVRRNEDICGDILLPIE